MYWESEAAALSLRLCEHTESVIFRISDGVHAFRFTSGFKRGFSRRSSRKLGKVFIARRIADNPVSPASPQSSDYPVKLRLDCNSSRREKSGENTREV
jgi:hypothetical protein